MNLAPPKRGQNWVRFAIALILSSIPFESGARPARTDGAVFERAPVSVETVQVKPFLEFRTGTGRQRVAGFNTSARPTMQAVNPGNTRDIRLADIPVVRWGSSDYLQLVLDASKIGDAHHVKLSKLAIFTRDDPFEDSDFEGRSDNQKYTHFVRNAALRWSFEGPDVLIDARVNAYGDRGDLLALIPVEPFKGLNPEQYVYLFSSIERPPSDSNEELRAEQWSVLHRPRDEKQPPMLYAAVTPVTDLKDFTDNPVQVPENTSTITLLMISMSLLFWHQWRTKRTSAPA